MGQKFLYTMEKIHYKRGIGYCKQLFRHFLCIVYYLYKVNTLYKLRSIAPLWKKNQLSVSSIVSYFKTIYQQESKALKMCVAEEQPGPVLPS